MAVLTEARFELVDKLTSPGKYILTGVPSEKKLGDEVHTGEMTPIPSPRYQGPRTQIDRFPQILLNAHQKAGVSTILSYASPERFELRHPTGVQKDHLAPWNLSSGTIFFDGHYYQVLSSTIGTSISGLNENGQVVIEDECIGNKYGSISVMVHGRGPFTWEAEVYVEGRELPPLVEETRIFVNGQISVAGIRVVKDHSYRKV